MRRWQKFLIALLVELLILGISALAYIAYINVEASLASPLEGRVIPAPGQAAAALPGADCTEIGVRTEDGVPIFAVHCPSRTGATIILLHGYRANHTAMLPVAALLVEHGYGVLLPDLRGHAASGGELVSFGYYEELDVAALHAWLLSQPGRQAERVGLYGESMGGAVAIYYTARHPEVRAVAAQSTITSLGDLSWDTAAALLPTPPALIAPFMYFWMERKLGVPVNAAAPVEHIARISPRPVFLLMGGQDRTVNPQGGQRLYAAAGEPKTLWYDESLGHLEFLPRHPEEFEQRLIAFFDQYLSNPDGQRRIP